MAGNFLNFQDVVTLQFNKNGKFAASEPNGAVNINRSTPKRWERFLLLNPDDLSSSAKIQYGQEVAILSYHNQYLVCEQNQVVNANREHIGPWEKWRFYNFFDHDKTGDITVAGSGNYKTAYLFLKSHQNTIMLPNASGNAMAVETQADNSPMPNNQTAIRVTLRNIWDFYYDKPIPYYDENGNNLCESRGRYDGANCFVGKYPSGKPFGQAFIYNNNFYYQCPSPNDVVMGYWDGAHAKVGHNDYDDIPFIYKGAFYIKPTSKNECVKNDFGTSGEVSLCPLHKGFKIEIQPKKPVLAQTQYGINLIGEAIPLNQIQYFKVCFKKVNTWGMVCKKNVQFTGTNEKIISGLESNQMYKVRAFYRRKGGSPEIKIGTSFIFTH